MAYRDDDDKEKEAGGDLLEGTADSGFVDEKDDDEDDLLSGRDAAVDDEKAWE